VRGLFLKGIGLDVLWPQAVISQSSDLASWRSAQPASKEDHMTSGEGACPIGFDAIAENLFYIIHGFGDAIPACPSNFLHWMCRRLIAHENKGGITLLSEQMSSFCGKQIGERPEE